MHDFGPGSLISPVSDHIFGQRPNSIMLRGRSVCWCGCFWLCVSVVLLLGCWMIFLSFFLWSVGWCVCVSFCVSLVLFEWFCVYDWLDLVWLCGWLLGWLLALGLWLVGWLVGLCSFGSVPCFVGLFGWACLCGWLAGWLSG